ERTQRLVARQHVPEDPWAKAKIISRAEPTPPTEEKAAKPGRKPMEEERGWKDMRPGAPKRGTADQGDRGKWRDMRKGRAAPDQDESARVRRRKGERKHKLRPEDRLQITAVRKKAVKIGATITVSELAGATGIKSGEIIKKLLELGVMATINQPIEGSLAELIATEHNIEVEFESKDLEDMVREEDAAPEDLESRPPIVTVMGHVDHGKTSLLDRIRQSDLTNREAGGITQHIGAYFVKSKAGDIVFLDTPGHEAFTSLRARGADVTDLVILVVAADDGVMPQTVEAIDHAKAAGVPIMVAINKMDKPGADPQRIKTQLMEHGLLSEDLGGDTVYVPVSAKSGEGIPQLLEMIHLQSEMADMKATRHGMARGYVIESKMDRQRGPLATVLVQRGTLRVGDFFVAGTTFGRIRAMLNDKGKKVEEAPPSIPVEILGCNEPPEAGDVFVVMEDEKATRQIANVRANRKKETETQGKRRLHLEDFLKDMGEDEVGVLNLVVKADTQGSLEAIKSSLAKMGNERVKVDFVRAGVGGISETDVSLAATTDSIVIGFCVRPQAKAQELGHNEGVDIKLYTVIYDLINDVHDALEGLLQPVIREKIIGHFEVSKLFTPAKGVVVAGGQVTDGFLQRNNASIRVFRDNVLIHTGSLHTLRRFTEDVADVQQGFECGVRLAGFNDLKEGDLLEAFLKTEEAQTLDRAGRQ
ncbi:MAG: translation initiation factor IF-2, partial [Deltaproteobacteria bacterium]|nr:translation initiation factor IF-2 [Deltaproteobacteria bacterium]